MKTVQNMKDIRWVGGVSLRAIACMITSIALLSACDTQTNSYGRRSTPFFAANPFAGNAATTNNGNAGNASSVGINGGVDPLVMEQQRAQEVAEDIEKRAAEQKIKADQEGAIEVSENFPLRKDYTLYDKVRKAKVSNTDLDHDGIDDAVELDPALALVKVPRNGNLEDEAFLDSLDAKRAELEAAGIGTLDPRALNGLLKVALRIPKKTKIKLRGKTVTFDVEDAVKFKPGDTGMELISTMRQLIALADANTKNDPDQVSYVMMESDSFAGKKGALANYPDEGFRQQYKNRMALVQGKSNGSAWDGLTPTLELPDDTFVVLINGVITGMEGAQSTFFMMGPEAPGKNGKKYEFKDGGIVVMNGAIMFNSYSEDSNGLYTIWDAIGEVGGAVLNIGKGIGGFLGIDLSDKTKIAAAMLRPWAIESPKVISAMLWSRGGFGVGDIAINIRSNNLSKKGDEDMIGWQTLTFDRTLATPNFDELDEMDWRDQSIFFHEEMTLGSELYRYFHGDGDGDDRGELPLAPASTQTRQSATGKPADEKAPGQDGGNKDGNKPQGGGKEGEAPEAEKTTTPGAAGSADDISAKVDALAKKAQDESADIKEVLKGLNEIKGMLATLSKESKEPRPLTAKEAKQLADIHAFVEELTMTPAQRAAAESLKIDLELKVAVDLLDKIYAASNADKNPAAYVELHKRKGVARDGLEIDTIEAILRDNRKLWQRAHSITALKNKLDAMQTFSAKVDGAEEGFALVYSLYDGAIEANQVIANEIVRLFLETLPNAEQITETYQDYADLEVALIPFTDSDQLSEMTAITLEGEDRIKRLHAKLSSTKTEDIAKVVGGMTSDRVAKDRKRCENFVALAQAVHAVVNMGWGIAKSIGTETTKEFEGKIDSITKHLEAIFKLHPNYLTDVENKL